MRLWSFHPKYLDNVGISRAINEGISGYKALTGQQKMWQNHSQLIRFKNYVCPDNFNKPKDVLQFYLAIIIDELSVRKFQQIGLKSDIHHYHNPAKLLTVTKGQLIYEWNHYLNKLKTRNPTKYAELRGILIP